MRSLLSTRSPTFKATGLEPASLDDEAILTVLQQDPRMLRRPLVRIGDDVVVGFDKPALERALA